MAVEDDGGASEAVVAVTVDSSCKLRLRKCLMG